MCAQVQVIRKILPASLLTIRTSDSTDMAEEQPAKTVTPKSATSEAENISRFAEHVDKRKRRKNLWSSYVDEQFRAKHGKSPTAHIPVVSQSTKTTEKKVEKVFKDDKLDADGIVGDGGKSAKEDNVEQAKEGKEEDVDEDGFVKTPCVGGLPKECDNMDGYELWCEGGGCPSVCQLIIGTSPRLHALPSIVSPVRKRVIRVLVVQAISPISCLFFLALIRFISACLAYLLNSQGASTGRDQILE